MISRKELRRPEDLRGKSIGIARAGNISERLSKAVVKKFNIPENEVTIRPVGGSQSERFQALRMNMVQAIVITLPLDVRAKNEGFNILYRLVDLGVPFVYSSVHANARMLRDRPDVVQRVVAAFAGWSSPSGWSAWVAVQLASLWAILWLVRDLLRDRLTARGWCFVCAGTVISATVYWHF